MTPPPPSTASLAATAPALPTQSRRAGQGFSALHGLRGGLAIWVMLYHTSSSAAGLLHVFRYGYLAVDMFFIMSGFILMHTHRNDFPRANARASLRFWSLRFWRTYPVNLAAFLLSLAISWAIARVLPGDAAWLADKLVFMNTWIIPVIDHAANGALWSLKVEWIGYLAFPLLAVALNRLPARGALLIAAPLILAIEISLFVGGLGGLAFDNMGFDRQLLRMAGGFALGCVLRVGFNHPLARKMTGDALMLSLVAGAVVELLLFDASGVLPFLTVIIMTACRPGRLTRLVLTNPVAMYLGRISFSIYMVHFPMMTLFRYLQDRIGAGLPSGVFTLGAVMSAYLMAALICRVVEEPARRFGRRLTQTWLPLPAATPADAQAAARAAARAAAGEG